MFFTNLPRVRIPKPTNRIYKQECCLSFDSPRSEGGLFVVNWLNLFTNLRQAVLRQEVSIPVRFYSKEASPPSLKEDDMDGCISPNHASFKLTKVIESKCTIEYVGFSLIFYFCTISARLTLKFVAVPDGLKAWEMLKGRPHNVDLIVTKVDLPSISGFALFTLIMEHDICKSIPVISMI
ncbi:hypothetical protein GOBAR_DD09398 [Gossypium barbadense]|nr:hypothetical protein GOBAR_DD09398 [Gossypium barbadense]